MVYTFFVCVTWVSIQGFVLARQVLYHLSHISSGVYAFLNGWKNKKKDQNLLEI
jgi:hypothetical protein